MLRSLKVAEEPDAPPVDISDLASDAAVETHLEAQQAAALEMQHCGRAWMERAAAERRTAEPAHPPSFAPRLSRLSSISPAAVVGGGGAPGPRHALSRLSCIVLNACLSLKIARALARALPSVAVVCWSTVVEDAAARAFLVGFLNELASRQERLWPPAWALRGRTADSASLLEDACFQAGCAAFSRGGYRFGDPTQYLHPPGHPHWKRPDFKSCRHCAPPVQGEVVLLRAVRGADGRVRVDETPGVDTIRSDGRSWRRRWRVITTGVRVAQRLQAWTRTHESVRDLHRAHVSQAGGGGGRGSPELSPALRKQRSADGAESPGGTGGLLYPEVGVASQLAHPGAFRRAHVLQQCSGGPGAGAGATEGDACGGRIGEASPSPTPPSPNRAAALRPLAVGDDMLY